MKSKKLFLCFTVAVIAFASCKKKEDDGGPNAPQNKQMAVAIKFTSQDCGACPGGTATMDQLKTTYGSNLVAIEVHGDMSGGNGDPMKSPNFYTWQQSRPLTGYPTIYINTDKISSFSVSEGKIKIDAMLAKSPEASCAASYSVSGETYTVQANGKFWKAGSGSYTWNTIFLVDGIAGGSSAPADYKQQSGSSTYTHNHVEWGSASASLLGDAITTTESGATFSKTWSKDINLSGVPGSPKVHPVVIIFKSGGSIVNLISASAK